MPFRNAVESFFRHRPDTVYANPMSLIIQTIGGQGLDLKLIYVSNVRSH